MTGTKLSLAVMAFATVIAAGCEDDDDKYRTSRDRDGDGIANRYDPRPDRDDVRDDDDAVVSRDRIGSREGMRGIPTDAKRVDTAEGSEIRYEANRDGRVYLYDADDDRVVYSGKLFRDERFIADPDDDELSVNGKKLGDVNLRAKHKYQLYFLRD